MNKYWFKQKTYGYGLTPISWEGWLMTILLAILIVWMVRLQINMIAENFLGLLIVLLEIAIVSIIFIKLSKSRSSGTLAWRWGNKK